MDYRSLAKALIHPLVYSHPGPWRIDQDWTIEVVDDVGKTVASHLSPEGAVAVLSLGEEIRTEIRLHLESSMLADKLGK